MNKKDFLEQAAFMEYNIDGDEWVKLFKKFGGSEHMAKHLWEKFHYKNHSILAVYGECDPDNKRIIQKMVMAHDWKKGDWHK